MKVVRFLLRSSKTIVIFALLAGLLSGAGNAVLLALINSMLTGRASSATELPTFIGLCLLIAISRLGSELLLIRLGQGTVLRLRTELSRQVLSVPLRRLEELGPHRILVTLIDDISQISNSVAVVPDICIAAAIIAGGLLYIGLLSWQVLLAVGVLIVIGFLGYQLPIVRANRYFELSRRLHESLYRHLRALTDGVKELKLNSRRREAFFVQQLEASAVGVRQNNEAGMRIYALSSSWGQLLVFVIIGCLLFALPRIGAVDAHLLTGFTLTLLFLINPLQAILAAVPTFERANIAIARVEQVGLDLSKSVRDNALTSEASPKSNWSRLDMAGITHAYRRDGEDSEFVLGPVELTLTPGELLFIVGGNGSGKTTLAKLLVGLYVPDLGEIRFDGHPITDENRDAYRQNFSVVFSDFYLFRDLLGLERPDLDGVARDYLHQLKLQNKVQVEDGRLSTTDLSQGQRKRLALLTAYLEDRPIYVFDEWAADQDPIFKDIFYRQLLPALRMSGKTSIVISHDDRYYDVADRIIKLADGQVVGEAPPELRARALGGDPAVTTCTTLPRDEP